MILKMRAQNSFNSKTMRLELSACFCVPQDLVAFYFLITINFDVLNFSE